MSEQKDNSGALFTNDKKGKEKAPDYKGKAFVDGVEKEISAWINTAKSGVKYMSLTFQEPYKSSGGDTAQADSGDKPF
jgi:uncharacterized protein (DUF736 family)